MSAGTAADGAALAAGGPCDALAAGVGAGASAAPAHAPRRQHADANPPTRTPRVYHVTRTDGMASADP